MRPLVISGAPGSGETTIARAICQSADNAVCIETDAFFDFVTHLIHPTDPASHHQNEIVISAYCRAARTYADGGYSVCFEGVIGPWFLKTEPNMT